MAVKPNRIALLGRNHKVHRLRAFAFLVRFDLEGDTLSFDQILQSCSFDCGDVNEHVAAAIIGLDEAIAAFSVEELDRTSHGHRETPPPYCSAVHAHARMTTKPARCRKALPSRTETARR